MNNNESSSVSNPSGNEIIKNLKRLSPDELVGDSKKKIQKIQDSAEKQHECLLAQKRGQIAEYKVENGDESNISNGNVTSVNHTSANYNLNIIFSPNTSNSEKNECESKTTSKIKTELVLNNTNLNHERGKKNHKNGSGNETTSHVIVEENMSNTNFEGNEIIIDSNSSSDTESDHHQRIEIDDALLEELRKGKMESFKCLADKLKLVTQKETLYEQFDSIINQKICEYFIEKSEIGKSAASLQSLLAREKVLQSKLLEANQTINELSRVISKHRAELITDPYKKPVICTRSIGLQVNLKPKEDDKRLNIKIPSKPTTVNSATSIDPVNISDDVNNKIKAIDFEESYRNVPSTSSLRIIEKTPLNKKSPSPVNNPSPFLLTKEVTPPVPTDSYCSTIDLTETDDEVNDENDVSTKLSLDKLSSTKRVQHKIINTAPLNLNTPLMNINQQSTQKTNNLSSTVISVNNLAYIEVPSTSPGYIVRNSLSSATPSLRPTQLSTVSNISSLNSKTLQTSGKKYLLKGHILPIELSTIRNTPQPIQPRIISSCNRQSALPLNLLKPVPAGIPLMTQHPAPPPTAPKQPKGSTAWGKLPSAPALTVKRKPDGPKEELVLSWTMDDSINNCANIKYYQIYVYHEVVTDVPKTDTWKKVGDVLAIPLPMACSLSQFILGEKYYFVVRAVDKYNRYGPFSTPKCQYIF